MAVLNYEVLDGKYAGGKILYDNLTWKNDDVETSAKRFNTVLAAIGVPDGTPIASIESLVRALKGKQLNIAVDWEHSEYTGKWNLSVKGYYKVDQEGSKPNGVERPSGALIVAPKETDLHRSKRYKVLIHSLTVQTITMQQ